MSFLFVNLQWIVLYWSDKSITNDKKHNEYNYNPAAIKFQCVFAVTFYSAGLLEVSIINYYKTKHL